MITKADIDALPTRIRNEIAEHLKSNMERAERAEIVSSRSFVYTGDEKHRSAALIAQGEFNAFSALYHVFK